MFNLKLVSLAVLLLAADVFATKITYSCRNGAVEKGKPGARETKGGGTVSDEFGTEIIENMGEWSGHRFKAVKNTKSGVIIVTSTDGAESKTEATTKNNEGEQIVNSHKP